MKTLKTERLIIRPWELKDLDDFYEYSVMPEVGPDAGWKPHESKEESLSILTSFIEDENVWAIEHIARGKVIGSLGLHNDQKRSVAECRMLGYVLSKDYWGMGLMTEAALEAVRYAFEELDLEVLSVYHYPFNTRSRRVIEKCGFTFEGVLRRSSRIYNGNIYDDMCYSILKEEYFDRRARR